MLIPFSLTLVFTIAGLLLMLVIARAAWRHRNPPEVEQAGQSTAATEPGTSATNRWLRGLRIGFTLLLVAVFSFHSYWVFKADSSKEFARAKGTDARNRRLAESALKGWVLDRGGKLEDALIRYRNDGGLISRDYPLGEAATHLTGYSDFVFGSGGMEFAFREWLTDPASAFNQVVAPSPVGKDLTVSIDSRLQRETFDLLKGTGKAAAAVVLLLPNNEVLAMASTPSFEPRSVTDDSTWRRMSEQAEDAQEISPLVNRALGTLVSGGPAFYYRPGSTFKVFTAAVAIESGMAGETFRCKAEGFTPPASGRSIRCFGGHVHGSIKLADAFKHSCNQYFAQLGLKVGRSRLADYARRLHMAVSPDDGARRGAPFWHVEHGDIEDFKSIFEPPVQRMNLSSEASAFDVALQSIGQGFDDFSVIQMALLASTVAGTDGAYVGPTFEVGAQRRIIGPFVSAQTAAELRSLMGLVVQGGTAAGAFASIDRGLTAGGKTGTADREMIEYDRNGNPVVYTDSEGNQRTRRIAVTDSWFIGFAPADKPQIAFAVMVEKGGAGAQAATPIAVKLIERAAQLGHVTGVDEYGQDRSSRVQIVRRRQ
jgi:penicillin-binding protein A